MTNTMDDGFMTNQGVQEKCIDWVKSQTDLCESPNRDTKRNADCDLDEFFDTDSEFDSVSECGAKKRRLSIQRKTEKLNLICQWKDCIFNTESIDKFIKHVANHMPDLPIIISYCGEEVYACPWKNCDYENKKSNEIIRHVNYHSYHTKLKCFGANVRGRVKLPKCYREPSCLDTFDVTKPQLCLWQNCFSTFNNYQMFIDHIHQHVESSPRGNNVLGGINCQWDRCKSKFPSVYKLRDHTRCHTKEKIVGCPDCGALFASNTKFYNHCRRQIPIEVQGFQCSYCLKFYPTETILREHVRFHVFKYKCSICEMSCESRASLAKHIRYRHVSSRPFSCQLCSHAAKSQQDLDSHMTVHTKGPNFFCNYEGCSYTCKSHYTFDRHIERYHCSEERWYHCHECPCKYRKSYSLTKHLTETHHLQWPTGHKRFIYAREDDGFYRLQRVRYECVEENEEENLPLVNPDDPPKKFKFQIDNTSSILKLEVIEGNAEDKSNDDEDNIEADVIDPDDNQCSNNNIAMSMPVISNIVISIDQLDADGNIIDSKVIRTQETSELPTSEEPVFILS